MSRIFDLRKARESFVLRGKLATVLLSALLTSCGSLQTGDFGIEENEVESRFAAGTVEIASFQPIPWFTIVDDLKPKFDIKSAKPLLVEVGPVVGGDDYRASRRLAADLGISLAGDVSESTQTNEATTTTDALGATQSTSSSTTSDQSSKTTPDEISVDPAASSSLIGSPGDLAGFTFDPDLKYRAATALFQNIQLLDKYLETPPGDPSKDAYLMRVQLTVSPFAHQMPYDVYTLLGFRTESDGPNYRIFPLIIADNLERINTRRITESLKAIELAIGGRSGSVSAGAGLEAALDKLRTLIGSDLNSLVTYSQPDDESLSVRLAAPFNSKSGYETRARTYDVMFVVVFDQIPAGSESKFTIFAESTFRHARTGKALPPITERDISKLASAVESEWKLSGCLDQNRFTSKPPCLPSNLDAQSTYKNMEDMTPEEYVVRGIYQPTETAPLIFNYFYDYNENYQLLRELLRARRASKYEATQVTLRPINRDPPPSQIAVFVDDGNKTTVSLGHAGQYDLSTIEAGLYYGADEFGALIKSGEPTKDLQMRLYNQSLKNALPKLPEIEQFDWSTLSPASASLPTTFTSVLNLNEGPFLHQAAIYANRNLQLEFPSLANLGLDTTKGSVSLSISVGGPGSEPRVYKLKRLKASKTPERTAHFQVTKLSKSFADGKPSGTTHGKAIATLVIEAISKTPQPADVANYRLTLSGAPLIQLEALKDDGSVDPANPALLKLSKNAATFSKIGGAFRVSTDAPAPLNSAVLFTVEALDNKGQPIEGEKVSGSFDPPKGESKPDTQQSASRD